MARKTLSGTSSEPPATLPRAQNSRMGPTPAKGAPTRKPKRRPTTIQVVPGYLELSPLPKRLVGELTRGAAFSPGRLLCTVAYIETMRSDMSLLSQHISVPLDERRQSVSTLTLPTGEKVCALSIDSFVTILCTRREFGILGPAFEGSKILPEAQHISNDDAHVVFTTDSGVNIAVHGRPLMQVQVTLAKVVIAVHGVTKEEFPLFHEKGARGAGISTPKEECWVERFQFYTGEQFSALMHTVTSVHGRCNLPRAKAMKSKPFQR